MANDDLSPLERQQRLALLGSPALKGKTNNLSLLSGIPVRDQMSVKYMGNQATAQDTSISGAGAAGASNVGPRAGEGHDSWNQGAFSGPGLGTDRDSIYAKYGLNSDGSMANQIGFPNMGAFPNVGAYPNMPAYPRPDFQANDFSGQAQQMTDRAYAPQYGILDDRSDDVDFRYKTSDYITGGLFSQLMQANEDATNEMNQGYGDSQSRTAALAENTQNAIESAYSKGQQQMVDSVKAAGGGPELLAALMQNGVDNSGFQQGQAARSGQVQGNYLEGQQQAMQDYQGKMGQAFETQGTVARQDLLGMRNQRQNEIGEQRSQLSSEQQIQAMQMAQQMQQQDINLQQLTYGADQDYYNATSDNLLGEANWNRENSLGAADWNRENATAGYDANVDQSRYGQSIRQAADQDIYGREQDQNNLAMNQAKLLASTQGQGQGQGGGLKPTNYGKVGGPMGKVFQTAKAFTSSDDEAQHYIALVKSKASSGGEAWGSPQDFAFAVSDQAKKNKLSPDVAFNIAISYYTNVYGKE